MNGPGAFNFTQNSTGPAAASNPLWQVACAFIHEPTKGHQEYQGAKNVLLYVGTLTELYAWAADIVGIQVLRVGQLFLIISTIEATTMSGRRWKEAIAKGAKDQLSISDPQVVGSRSSSKQLRPPYAQVANYSYPVFARKIKRHHTHLGSLS